MELGAEADAVPNDHALRQEIDRRILKLEAAVAYHSIMLDEIEGQLAQRGELRTIIWSNRMTAQLADLRDLFAGLRRE